MGQFHATNLNKSDNLLWEKNSVLSRFLFRSQANLSSTPALALWWQRPVPLLPSPSFWDGLRRRRTASSSDTPLSIRPLLTPAKAQEAADQISKTPQITASYRSYRTLRAAASLNFYTWPRGIFQNLFFRHVGLDINWQVESDTTF